MPLFYTMRTVVSYDRPIRDPKATRLDLHVALPSQPLRCCCMQAGMLGCNSKASCRKELPSALEAGHLSGLYRVL